MKKMLKEYLFDKHYLVSENDAEEKDAFESAYSLYALYGVKIVSGGKYACKQHLGFVANMLGKMVPAPFYKGFPESVRALSPDELLFDQLVSYVVTYGFGNFDEPRHSILEQLYERQKLDEDVKPVNFSILSEKEAEDVAKSIALDLLKGTRPLNERQYCFLLDVIKEYGLAVKSCASKNTTIRLMADTHCEELADMLVLSDVYKLTDWINYYYYGGNGCRKLNLKNQDRKFISHVIDRLMTDKTCDLRTCFEKKAFWCGLLHHIHYKPKNAIGESFVQCMRNEGNGSVYSDFEAALANGDIERAIHTMLDGKGSGALLRNIDFILSRCQNDADVQTVISNVKSSNGIILLQLLLKYSHQKDTVGRRSFKFTRYNRLVQHRESVEEAERRRSVVPAEIGRLLLETVKQAVTKRYEKKLGKVYVDEAMKMIALPIQENTSMGGYGTLTKGSRVKLEENAGTIRAFTYWEKVHDIDLSVIGIDPAGGSVEFSWRTMANSQSSAITFSGDETSGFNGGSEFFDINIDGIRKKFPQIRYLVFCDNIYSKGNFNNCFCKAGYMLRQKPNSGEIFEPKTVKSSFTISADSSFAYMFAIDLQEMEMIWLNCADAANFKVAGMAQYEFLLDYFDVTSIINVYSFFTLLAGEITDNPSEADIVVSDREIQLKPGATQIRSFDTEKIMAIM